MAFDLTKFFENLNGGARWDVGVSINRSNSLPLDANSIFATKILAEKYAQGLVGANAEYTGSKENPTYTYPGAEKILNNAYPGQIIAVVGAETVEVYYIDANRNLQEVGAKMNFNADDFVVGEDGTIGLAKLPEVVEATEGAIAVTKNEAGNYELNLKLANQPNNIARIDVDDDPGLFVPAPGYIKGDKITLEETVETVDVLVELAGTNTSNLKGNYITTYTPYGIEKRIADAGHASMMVVASVDLENKTYTDAEGQTFPVVKNVIYLVKDNEAQGSDVYFEYVLVNYTDKEGGVGQKFILIGDTSTDLSNYYDKNAIDLMAEGIEGAIQEAQEKTAKDILEAIPALIPQPDTNGTLTVDYVVDVAKLHFNINNTGNVVLEDTADGLKASVEIPEVTIPDIVIGERTATAEKDANTALVIQQLEVDDENGHKLVETPIEVVTKGILKDTGLVDPKKVYAQQIIWIDDGDGSEITYQDATLDTILGQLAEANKSDNGVLVGKAGLMSVADKYKLDKLVIGEDGEVGISGTISADNVIGLDDKVIKVITGAEKTADWAPIEPGAQVNIIESISLGGEEALPINDKQVAIPIATEQALGVIKSAAAVNKIQVAGATGEAEVHSLSTDKLVQGAEELILYGGNSGAAPLVPTGKTLNIQHDGTDFTQLIKMVDNITTWNDFIATYPTITSVDGRTATLSTIGSGDLAIVHIDGTPLKESYQGNTVHSKDTINWENTYRGT